LAGIVEMESERLPVRPSTKHLLAGVGINGRLCTKSRKAIHF
jgi:hypothetical protein